MNKKLLRHRQVRDPYRKQFTIHHSRFDWAMGINKKRGEEINKIDNKQTKGTRHCTRGQLNAQKDLVIRH